MKAVESIDWISDEAEGLMMGGIEKDLRGASEKGLTEARISESGNDHW